MNVMSRDGGRPRVGISRCLLGDEVRHDGGHKRDALLISTLGALVEWVPVCPEVEVGMGTPREAIDLIESDDGVPAGQARVRLLGAESRTDWTGRMTTWSAERVLMCADLDGYVLKSDSPSCGLQDVRVHGSAGVARVRADFLSRVFAYRRRRLLIPSPEPRLPNPQSRILNPG